MSEITTDDAFPVTDKVYIVDLGSLPGVTDVLPALDPGKDEIHHPMQRHTFFRKLALSFWPQDMSLAGKVDVADLQPYQMALLMTANANDLLGADLRFLPAKLGDLLGIADFRRGPSLGVRQRAGRRRTSRRLLGGGRYRGQHAGIADPVAGDPVAVAVDEVLRLAEQCMGRADVVAGRAGQVVDLFDLGSGRTGGGGGEDLGAVGDRRVCPGRRPAGVRQQGVGPPQLLDHVRDRHGSTPHTR
ncbi:hypothetical protein FHR81_002210 [Actinoalloteichus hoggarensis]|uniref:hypothetical protein n=1 Tax=Actinoalloteichus hoggarensis TaxID=1470176 RepID=UPI0012FDB376|nr:hypothetical protein [Actinoalloteichus hoggarensis]MBB5921172.1 hypothetical protein [Actinoalloteichus hoggarensis]